MSTFDMLIALLASVGVLVPLMQMLGKVMQGIVPPESVGSTPTPQNPVTYSNGSFYVYTPHGVMAIPMPVALLIAYYIAQSQGNQQLASQIYAMYLQYSQGQSS